MQPMMKVLNRLRPRSMLSLVATGYLVVAMPLILAIPLAYKSVGELTNLSQALVVDTAALVDLGAALGDQLGGDLGTHERASLWA